MKKKISYILIFIGLILCTVGISISANKSELKSNNNNNITTNMRLLYSNLELDKKISNKVKQVSSKINDFSNEFGNIFKIPDPTNNYFVKNVNGIEYYVLSTIENTKYMEHQQTYQRLAREENRPNKTNCLCYAYAYAEAMIYGSTTQEYREVERCDYPGAFRLYLDEDARNIQIAYDEILNGRPSVIHGTGCGSANQHYFVIVGITTESYKKYVTNGKVNAIFNSKNRNTIMNSLLVYDPWGENREETGFYNLGKEIPYYSNSCKWDVDNYIRYKEK